jgi:hypothetical protein
MRQWGKLPVVSCQWSVVGGRWSVVGETLAGSPGAEPCGGRLGLQPNREW